jgi:hypothetical protein
METADLATESARRLIGSLAEDYAVVGHSSLAEIVDHPTYDD